MRNVLGGCVLAVLLCSATAAEAIPPLPQKWEMHFSPGTQRVISVPANVRGFAMREEGLLEVRPIGNNQLLMTASKAGDTPLLFFGPGGPISELSVEVSILDLEMRVCDLCKFLPKRTRLAMEVVGVHVIVSGIAQTLEEARGVKLMTAMFPHIVIPRVKLAERAMRMGLLRVNRELWRAGFLDARAVVMGDRVVLTGCFASSNDEARARATLAPYAAWLEERLLPIEPTAP